MKTTPTTTITVAMIATMPQNLQQQRQPGNGISCGEDVVRGLECDFDTQKSMFESQMSYYNLI